MIFQINLLLCFLKKLFVYNVTLRLVIQKLFLYTCGYKLAKMVYQFD